MSAVAALAVAAEEPAGAALAPVLGDGASAAGPRAARLAALLHPGFLAEAGWDPATWLLAPESEHRLIRWDGSRRACSSSAGMNPGRITYPCICHCSAARLRSTAVPSPAAPLRGNRFCGLPVPEAVAGSSTPADGPAGSVAGARQHG